MAVTLDRAKEILGLPTMTISGRVNEIKRGEARNSGKVYYKVFVTKRSDNIEVSLFAWSADVIADVKVGQNYDFDVDYSDKEMKYRQINRAQAVTYVDEESDSRGYPESLDEPKKSIEVPSAPPASATAWKNPKQENDIHIIRESALKSAAAFFCRPSFVDKSDEDDLIYVASKLEDYIKNGAIL